MLSKFTRTPPPALRPAPHSPAHPTHRPSSRVRPRSRPTQPQIANLSANLNARSTSPRSTLGCSSVLHLRHADQNTIRSPDDLSYRLQLWRDLTPNAHDSRMHRPLPWQQVFAEGRPIQDDDLVAWHAFFRLQPSPQGSRHYMALACPRTIQREPFARHPVGRPTVSSKLQPLR